MSFEMPGQARMADVAKAITEAALRPPEPAPTLLYSPFALGRLTLPNRTVMAAMATGFASPAGLPTRRLVAWYGARAAGGSGLVVVEGANVAPLHQLCAGSRFAQHRLRLDDDVVVSAYVPLVQAIQRGGARAAVQLTYPAVRDLLALPAGEIGVITRAYGDAARRARAAGFDAVEVQCTYRSLFAQLLSPASNQRRDGYGRGPKGRLRAILEGLRAIREAAGDDFPVIVKLSVDEYLPRGLTPEKSVPVVLAVQQAGATALEVIAGAVASDAQLRLSAGVGEAVLADLAAKVKETVEIPVIAAGRLLTADGAEGVLRQGQADLVSLGRALLADPAWLAKARAGVDLEVIPCIACMACFTPAPDGGIGCPVNGEAGQEHQPPFRAAERPRRVTVLGASLAAFEVARVAAARGHDVTLTTAGLPLGGLLGLRAGVPGNAEFGRAFLYFGDRLVELGVSIADGDDGAETAGGVGATDGVGRAGARGAADVTIDCRPEAERRPAWARGRGVLLAGNILGRDLHEMYGIGRRVAVAGPGALAAEAALFLAGWGRRPTVVVPGAADDPFPDVHPTHAARLRERLEGYKVPLVTGAVPVAWRYDPDRKSVLAVVRDGREEPLGPFQTLIAAAGWPAAPRQAPRLEALAGRRTTADQKDVVDPAERWPAAVRAPRVPRQVPDGTTLRLGDTPYPEPLRDLVQYAHRLGRII